MIKWTRELNKVIKEKLLETAKACIKEVIVPRLRYETYYQEHDRRKVIITSSSLKIPIRYMERIDKSDAERERERE